MSTAYTNVATKVPSVSCVPRSRMKLRSIRGPNCVDASVQRDDRDREHEADDGDDGGGDRGEDLAGPRRPSRCSTHAGRVRSPRYGGPVERVGDGEQHDRGDHLDRRGRPRASCGGARGAEGGDVRGNATMRCVRHGDLGTVGVDCRPDFPAHRPTSASRRARAPRDHLRPAGRYGPDHRGTALCPVQVRDAVPRLIAILAAAPLPREDRGRDRSSPAAACSRRGETTAGQTPPLLAASTCGAATLAARLLHVRSGPSGRRLRPYALVLGRQGHRRARGAARVPVRRDIGGVVEGPVGRRTAANRRIVRAASAWQRYTA